MNLIEGVHYIVTKSSDDGTFEIGDRIWALDDGCVMCSCGGWVAAEDVEAAMVGVEVRVDESWIKREQEMAQAKLNRLEAMRLAT